MKVGSLVKKLLKMDQELEVIVDGNEDGYYDLDAVSLYLNEVENEDIYCNLVSSNET